MRDSEGSDMRLPNFLYEGTLVPDAEVVEVLAQLQSSKIIEVSRAPSRAPLLELVTGPRPRSSEKRRNSR